eukprot:TRINITY_DN56772_c0_g1_i1.p2 TRINITY_DN56772_c0_g1~~TRINITY_DN56772_c0_g1_i1.p2  ORF type:complete len:107 (-),score=18.37 TRINITY_DN56772_c0_g1_i1:317-637(-)
MARRMSRIRCALAECREDEGWLESSRTRALAAMKSSTDAIASADAELAVSVDCQDGGDDGVSRSDSDSVADWLADPTDVITRGAWRPALAFASLRMSWLLTSISPL